VLCLGASDVDLLGDLDGVIYLDAEIPNRASARITRGCRSPSDWFGDRAATFGQFQPITHQRNVHPHASILLKKSTKGTNFLAVKTI
jgi:hypothetical protein